MIDKYWIEASETLFDRLEEIGLEPLIERDKETYAYYISDGWFCGATKHFIELECTLTPRGIITEAGEIETRLEPFIRVHTPTQEMRELYKMGVVYAKNPTEWEKLSEPIFERFNGGEVLIHKRHEKIADAVVANPGVVVECNCKDDTGPWFTDIGWFFEDYQGDKYNYRLAPTVEPFTVTEVETDVDPKVIAEYVGKDPESMRQLKRKGTGLWIHYVRSYKYSLGGQNNGNI